MAFGFFFYLKKRREFGNKQEIIAKKINIDKNFIKNINSRYELQKTIEIFAQFYFLIYPIFPFIFAIRIFLLIFITFTIEFIVEKFVIFIPTKT